MNANFVNILSDSGGKMDSETLPDNSTSLEVI